MSVHHLPARERADYMRYASPARHLYHLLGVESGVRVNGRLAKLVTAREDGCQILWQTGRKTASYVLALLGEPPFLEENNSERSSR